MAPYLLTSLLFLALAVLAAVDAAAANAQLLPWFSGLRWLRVHLITLGVGTELLFGLLPPLLAASRGRPRPAARLDIWLLLTAGIVILLIGVPLVDGPLMIGGGALIFAATLLLAGQLAGMRSHAVAPRERAFDGRWFYVTGLAFLLLGVVVGTGMWQGWNQALGMRVPIEVHIHANNWGFLSLVFAGLMIDLLPLRRRAALASASALRLLYAMMALGALGLVLGPWTGSRLFTVPGLILHVTATVWLLRLVVRAFRREGRWWTPGPLHIVGSYLWILAPIAVAPLILLQVPGFPGVGIEQNAPQALIYGWVLQFTYALLPYLFARYLARDPEADLGGSWWSLGAVHLGSALLWLSIFVEPAGPISGAAYALWALSMLPIVGQLWRSLRRALERIDGDVAAEVAPADLAIGD